MSLLTLLEQLLLILVGCFNINLHSRSTVGGKIKGLRPKTQPFAVNMVASLSSSAILHLSFIYQTSCFTVAADVESQLNANM